ncbi:MAG: hypothetical protein JHD16_08660 [Solirubrobacteraceae bacterium]|nr:hypothetical protein [Solirubrobacteraceae bacterium]
MQLTLAEPAVESIDLVLAAWSQAAPAIDAELDALDVAELSALEAQLQLRLEGASQIPLWEMRGASTR